MQPAETKCSSRIRCHHLLKTFWGWRDQQLPTARVIIRDTPLNVPYLRRRRAALALCLYGAQVRKLRWPGELSVRLAVYGPPLRTALVVGDVIALTAFERCLASWNVLLCIASGAGNRLHPLRYSRRYEYGRQNT